MTTFTPQPTATAAPAAPRRRTLVVLAGIFLVVFAAMLATGASTEPDSSLATIRSAYDDSDAVAVWSSYLGMALCALLVFFGVALRTALRARRAVWTADVAMLGFLVIALTIAGWVVSGRALWHAVDQGEDTAIRTLNYIDTSNFLPLMTGMVCAMVGTGLAGYAAGALPRWLAVVSVVLGCLAPLGPLGFVPALLLPVWVVVVAATVRLHRDAQPAS